MDRFTTGDWLSVVLFSIGYLVMGIAAFIKLNIKNTENAKDILALRNEFDEHKEDNRQERREVNATQALRNELRNESSNELRNPSVEEEVEVEVVTNPPSPPSKKRSKPNQPDPTSLPAVS